MQLAVRQLGLVTRSQALALGLSEAQIRTLMQRHIWIPLYQGVYLVTGFQRTWEQQTLAACLFSKGYASHSTAAHLYRLLGQPDVIDITCAAARRSLESVRFHRTEALPANDIARVSGVPCLSPTRMLCGLGADVDDETLEHVVEQALHRRLTTTDRLWRRLDQLGGKGRRGIKPLRALLSARGAQPPAESFLEVRAIRLLRRARLHPARQFPVRTRRIDLAFPDVRLGIELLGDDAHAGKPARQRDAVRHNELAAEGWTILYFTYDDVMRRPEVFVATVKAELIRLRRPFRLV